MFILRESIWYFFFFQMCLAPILVIFAIHITCNFTPPLKKMFVGLINILCIIFFFLHLVQCNKLVPEIKLIKSVFFKFTFDISRGWEWILRNLLLYWKLKIKLQWPQSWDNSYLAESIYIGILIHKDQLTTLSKLTWILGSLRPNDPSWCRSWVKAINIMTLRQYSLPGYPSINL